MRWSNFTPEQQVQLDATDGGFRRLKMGYRGMMRTVWVMSPIVLLLLAIHVWTDYQFLGKLQTTTVAEIVWLPLFSASVLGSQWQSLRLRLAAANAIRAVMARPPQDPGPGIIFTKPE